MLTLTIIVILSGIILFVLYLIYNTSRTIAYYEKQGVMIYPGAKSWVLGNAYMF